MGDIDLDELLPGCTSSTWADKKRLCAMEAANYAAAGLGVDSNPYIPGSWPYRWFNEAFLECVESYGEC